MGANLREEYIHAPNELGDSHTVEPTTQLPSHEKGVIVRQIGMYSFFFNLG